jgi:TfoX/Sxy family transcriptional regulator of competence genes
MPSLHQRRSGDAERPLVNAVVRPHQFINDRDQTKMAYDENLADRVRRILTRRADIEERAMFGGLAFMAHGHMCCGLVKDQLIVRVNSDAYEQLLGEVGAQPMDFTGKPMRGFLYVTRAGTSTPSGLRTWVERALKFAENRPPKTSGRISSKSTRQPDRALPPTSRSRSARKSSRKRSRAARG